MEAMEHQKLMVYSNTVTSMADMLTAMDTLLDIKLHNSDNQVIIVL